MTEQQGDTVRILMQHCRDMKRQEARLRWATVILLISFFCILLWFQIYGCVGKEDGNQKKLENKEGHTQSIKHGKPRVKALVHLQTAEGYSQNQTGVLKKDAYALIKWQPQHGSGKEFYLEDENTSVVVSKEGNYFINLKLLYKVPPEYDCNSIVGGFFYLYAAIMHHRLDYPEWLKFVDESKNMHCVKDSLQSLTLSRVTTLKPGTKLNVQISPDNYELITWSKNIFFDITLL